MLSYYDNSILGNIYFKKIEIFIVKKTEKY